MTRPPGILSIHLDDERLQELCRKRHIRKRSFFGSVLRDDFRDDSDVDLLIEFEEGHTPGRDIVDIEDEISRLRGGRKTDIVNPRYLNHCLKKRVIESAVVRHEAPNGTAQSSQNRARQEAACCGLISSTAQSSQNRARQEAACCGMALARVRGRSLTVAVLPARQPCAVLLMSHDDLAYIGHVPDTARKIAKRVAAKTRADCDADEDLQVVVAHFIQIIGEAAGRVSTTFREQHPRHATSNRSRLHGH